MMDLRFMKPMIGLVILVLAALIALSVFCLWGRKVETYRDKNVTAGEIQSPFYTLAVHISKPKYLTIFGKTFMGVRGGKPFYLEIPGLNSILFVTEESNYHVFFYVANLATKKIISVDGNGSGFGSNIGSAQKVGDVYTDFIEKAESDTLLIATRYPERKEVTALNLTLRKVEREDTYYYNERGQITKHTVNGVETR